MNARRGTRARLSRLRSAISRGVSERVRGAFEECGIGVLRQDVACAGAALHGTVVQEGNEVACISSRFRAVRPHVRLRAHYPLWRGAAPPVEKRRAASDRRCGIRYGFRYCTMCSIMRHPIRDLSAIPTAKTGDGISGARSNGVASRDRGLTQSVSMAHGQRFVRAAGTRSRDLVPTYLGIRREPCQRER